MSGKTLIPGINFAVTGSGSSTGGSLADQLAAAENGQLLTRQPNQIMDIFNGATSPTLSNMSIGSSKLVPTADEPTVGTYERNLQVSSSMSNVQGLTIASMQALAPKAIDLVVSGGQCTIKFAGDVAAFFTTVGASVLLANRLTSDGAVRHQIFVDPLTNKPAQLAIAVAGSYSAGSDETTLVLTSGSYTQAQLQMGVATGSMYSQFRVIPFDFSIKASSTTQGNYETLSVDDIYGLPDVRIAGESYLSKISGTIVGTILKTDAAISLNRQYVLVRVMEKLASNSLFHWFGSSDYGKTFIEYGTKSYNYSPGEGEEFSGNAEYTASQLAVANNGRFVSAYPRWSGSYIEIYAVQGDMSVGASSFLDLQSTGGTGTLGKVNGGASNYTGKLAIDKVDCSFIAFWGSAAVNSTGQVDFYTRSGSTISYIARSGSISPLYSVGEFLFVVGSGNTHRVIFIAANSGYQTAMYYWDQASASSMVSNTFSSSADFGVPSGQGIPVAATITSDGYCYVLFRDAYGTVVPTGDWIAYSSNVLTGSPTFTRSRLTSGLISSNYVGWSTAQNKNQLKTPARIAANPADSKHICIVDDLQHPDSVDRAHLYEICDITSYVGSAISYTIGADASTMKFRDTTSNQIIAQTFVAPSRTRSIGVHLHAVGTIPSGNTLTADVFATSGGVPTGAKLFSSTNSIDPSLITKNTSGQWLYFNFANSFTNGTTYAIALRSSFAVSSSNYLIAHGGSSTSAYSTNPYSWNNSAEPPTSGSWTIIAGSNRFNIEVNGEYVTQVGQALDDTVSWTGAHIHDQESQIELIDSSTAAIVSRRATLQGADSTRPFVGHPFRRVLSFGSGGAQSTLTSPVIAGYAPSNYDANLVFTTSLGSDDCARKDTITGAIVATDKCGEHSGMNLGSGNSASMTAGNWITDDTANGFDAGSCTFNGSSQYITYYNAALNYSLNVTQGVPFCMEMEVKIGGGAGTTRTIVGDYRSDTSYGWMARISAANTLEFQCTNTGGTTVQRYSVETFAVGDYLKIRYQYDGSTLKIYRKKITDSNFIEVIGGYTRPADIITTGSSSGYQLEIGGAYSGGGQAWFFNGKIGYIKIALGSSTFQYSGYKSQPSITGIINLGTEIVGEYRIGHSGSTAGQNYIQPAFIPRFNNQAVVDSNDLQIMYSQPLANAVGNNLWLKLSMGRGSSRNISSVQGIDFQFSK